MNFMDKKADKITIMPLWENGRITGWIAELDERHLGLDQTPDGAVRDLISKMAREQMETLLQENQ